MPTRSRIAPTPSGYLHIGNAFNFLLTEYLTRQKGGLLRLRIDDLDAPRVRQEYIADVFDTIRWLGIVPDEELGDEAAYLTLHSQRTRMEGYRRMLSQLAETGKVFACNCSRADIQRSSSDGQYPGNCRDKGLPLDTPDAAWRFRTEENDVASWNDGILGRQTVPLFTGTRDFIVRRRDGLPAYQVASVCDDEDFGINLIVRGTDLINSTAAQLQLAAALGLETFRSCRFYHHPLLQNEAGEKLSKSAGGLSLKAMRAEGALAADLRRMAVDWYRGFLPAADLIL